MISRASTFLGPKGIFQGGGATPSLVLSLDTDNVLSFSPTESNIWYDLSKRKNNGILNDTSVSEYVKLSLDFNGTSSFVSFTQSNGIPLGTSSYTIETWFNSDSYAPSEQGSLVSWGTPFSPGYSNAIRLEENGIRHYWWNNDITANFTGTQSLYVGNWYYVAASYDGLTRKLYLNGEVIGSDEPGEHLVDDSSTLKIGYDGLNYFNGKISKVKINSKALGDSKILSNFNADKVSHGYVFGSMTFSSSQLTYVSSSSSDYIIGTNSFTLEAFVKTSTQSNYSGVVSMRDYSDTGLAININLYGQPRFLIQGSYHESATMSVNTWYHFAMSRDNGTTSCYINGVLEHEFSDTNDYTLQDLVIGRYYTNNSDFYIDGLISNVRLINGVGIYTGSSFTIPNTPLQATNETVLLIASQITTPTTDISGNLQSTTNNNNVGWTSSSPSFYEFEYLDFSSTAGLELISTYQIASNYIYLTNITNSDVGNVYTSNSYLWNRNFNLTFNFQCSGGNGADGFCVQWTNTNNSTGGVGGDVGAIYSAHNLFQFKTWTNNLIQHWNQNSSIGSQLLNGFSIRQNVYYWMDYDFDTSTMLIYYSTTDTKPGSPQHTFASVTFDDGSYFFGIGAACGGSNDYHILKSMRLTFA